MSNNFNYKQNLLCHVDFWQTMSAAASWCWNVFKWYPAQERTVPRTKGETLQIPETLPYQEHASSYAILENFRLDSSGISQKHVRETCIVLLMFKNQRKKVFPLRSSSHTVWKCNLARKNNSSKAIRQTEAKCSLAKLLKFAAADFAENSISPEQAAASSCVRTAKVFLQMQIPLSASKAHKQFLLSPQALARWEKWHRKVLSTESREVSKFMKMR